MSFLEQLGSSLQNIGDFAQKAQPIYNQWEQNNQMAHLYDLARARPELYGNMYSNAINAQQENKKISQNQAQFQQELAMKQSILDQEMARRNQAAQVLQSLGGGGDYKTALSQLASIDPDKYGSVALQQSNPLEQLDELTKRAELANKESEQKLKNFRINQTLQQYGMGGDVNQSSPLSVRNNNFGNLRNPQTGDFQQYATPEEGKSAMLRDLALKLSGKSPVMQSKYGQGYTPTIENVVSTWAPPSENDTQNYINFVSKQTGLAPNQPLLPADVERIAPAIAQMEGGAQGAQAYQSAQAPKFDQTEFDLAMNKAISGKTEDIKAYADYMDKKNNPTASTEAGKLQSDYQKGLISKDVYESQTMKLTKEAEKSKQDAEEKSKGQQQLDDILSSMSSKLDTLKEKGGITSEKSGVFQNIIASMANKEDGALFGLLPSGQQIGRSLGTPEQTLRDQLAAQKLAVLRAIQKTTGMNAQQLNSNQELKTMLDSIDNPNASYEARKSTLEMLSNMYGSGKLGKEPNPSSKEPISQNGWKIEVVQ